MKKILDNMEQIIWNCYKWSIRILFAAIVVYLLYLSGLSTSYMSNTEKTYLVSDNIWKNLLVVVAGGGGVFLIKKIPLFQKFMEKLETDDKSFLKAKRILLTFIFALGAVLVVSIQSVPIADQFYVLKLADELRTGAYSEFEMNGYLQTYPNQAGIVVIAYLLSFLVGNRNYIAFQMMNVVGLTLIYKMLSEIADLWGMKKTSQLAIIALGIVFLPLTMYVNFVYGTIGGLLFSLVAIKHEIVFLRTYKIKNLLMSSVCIALGIMFKSNYLIFMVGMLIYAFVELLKKRNKKILLLIAGIIFFAYCQNAGTASFIETKTGNKLGKGVSNWAWVSMGFMDNADRCAGWYNGYNYLTYQMVSGDTTQQEQIAKEGLQSRIKYFQEHKKEAIDFFAQKNASQWNDPTFQGIWIVQGRPNAIDTAPWVKDFLSVSGIHKIASALDFLQFGILFGVLLYLLLYPGKNKNDELIFQMIIVGGFIFHTFWEAKGQYTLPFFVLFLPMSIHGYDQCFETIEAYGSKRTVKKDWTIVHVFQNKKLVLAGIMLMSAILLSNIRIPYISDVLCLNSGNDMYADYIYRHTYDSINEGTYRICPKENETYRLDIREKDHSVCVQAALDETDNIRIETWDKRLHIAFVKENLFLDLPEYELKENQKVQACGKNTTDAQRWHLKKVNGVEEVYFLIGYDKALTYNMEDGSVYISTFTGAENQKWSLK